ncbi:rhamnan synthesis F family protein [Acidocella sp.]|uniref:rhamnan synthesis F family protein n=1 Tax=Acidocella sp. TaxID=50710 RepID=UPI0026273825|nr:rhamnan synthesis F family protein [Acidocella sp.]MDD2794555.1 rhamnan synthesis F family protein [Acidocella sp.]
MMSYLKKQIRAFFVGCKWYVLIPGARFIGQLRSPRQILRVWPEGEVTLGLKIAIFMHFDGRGVVRAQLLDYMRELRENGRTVVFVSNAGKLLPASLAALREICAVVILRRNIGYDFGAWRDAMDYLGLPRADTEEVILANDSVFGPLVPLGDVLRRLNYEKADIWGLTESWQVRYHLQSFFLAFGPAALRAPAWEKFWRSVRPVPMKSYIVNAYEVGVTQAMVKGGLRCAALWPYEMLIKLVNRGELEKLIVAEESELGKADPIQITRKLQVLRIRDGVARRVALNPTSDLWRQLLLSGFPFIKRELLRDNPTKVEDVGDWVEVVRDSLAADPEPILQDLRTMLKGGAP